MAPLYINNPLLKTLTAPSDWRGTPVDLKGRFINLYHPFYPSTIDLIRWKFQRNEFKIEKKAEIWNPPVFKDYSWLDESDDIIVWIGQSTFYIRINGISILTDPVFGDILSVKRRSDIPLDIRRLTNLDYVLVSHDHRDHLDGNSLRMLSEINPNVKYLAGLNMESLIFKYTKSSNINVAGWYQQYNTDERTTITFIPSRHWSKRGLFDTNRRLWGGFLIEADGKRLLFGGDSGYDIHYKQFSDLFGSFDYAILGIGAYAPSWFMSPNHQSPTEAVRAFADLKANRFIPMHYGTFDLSDEPMASPLKELNIAITKAGMSQSVEICQIGLPLKLYF
jgi:L-ascorbate metabolism protein UlaG (beta-lactamase superfamily)